MTNLYKFFFLKEIIADQILRRKVSEKFIFITKMAKKF